MSIFRYQEIRKEKYCESIQLIINIMNIHAVHTWHIVHEILRHHKNKDIVIFYRYSRKEGYFEDVPKDEGYPKKLCFKFGPKSHGWKRLWNVNAIMWIKEHVKCESNEDSMWIKRHRTEYGSVPRWCVVLLMLNYENVIINCAICVYKAPVSETFIS